MSTSTSSGMKECGAGLPDELLPPLTQNMSVVKTFAGKNIFLTGATGFVGKVILEKILRGTPDVNTVYVLVRPRKGQAPQDRLREEVLGSEIFTTLRKQRPDFDAFAAKKLVAIPGELTQALVGLNEKDRATLKENVDIIIHCAAVVDFNERIDRAVELNTLGSLRMLELGKECKHLGAFVHVSTCYVNSNQDSGNWVEEKLYPLGFDAQTMVDKIQKLSPNEVDTILSTGILRNWPNTYTFTKAMTEHLLVANRGTVPLVIVRPSIVGAAFTDPVPGWVDVISAAGAVFLAVGMGVVKFLQGDPENIGDVIPVDYVSNSILVSIPAIYNQNRYFICQAASSSENPMAWGSPVNIIQSFFNRHPPPRSIAPAAFRFFRSPQMYQLMFLLQYSVPSTVLNTLALVNMGVSKEQADQYSKLVWQVRVIIEAFRHFVLYQWTFDNRNVRAIYQMLVPEERELFRLDLSDLRWDRYSELFAYGLTNYTLKTPLIPAEQRDYKHLSITAEKIVKLNMPWTSKVFPDVDAVYRVYKERMEKYQYPVAPPIPEMITQVLSSQEVRDAIDVEAKFLASLPAGKKVATETPQQRAENRARKIVENMFGQTNDNVINSLAWFFRKVWRRVYEGVHVALNNLSKVLEAAGKGPIVFIPTHRSYIDFLIVSYLSMMLKLPLPHIAAGEDFLGIFFVRWLFRNSGAFFIRRTFAHDSLYTAILQKYVELLLANGQSLEFFIEGTRSRTGKMLHPKMGFLTMLTTAIAKGVVNDVTIVPVTINYEKTMEGNMYASELSGERKVKESLSALIKARNVLNAKFGNTTVVYGKPISVVEWTKAHTEAMNKTDGLARITSSLTRERDLVLKVSNIGSSDLPRITLPEATPASTTPPNEYSSPNMPTSTSASTSTSSAGTVVASSSSSSTTSPSSSSSYDIVSNAGHRRYFNRSLAYYIVHELALGIECMPTHLVATLMLQYRQGITRSQLLAKFDWLRKELLQRGGYVYGCEMDRTETLVDDSLKYLSDVVHRNHSNVYEPAITARHEYTNMLVLGQYKNRLVHYFYREALWCVVLYAMSQSDYVPFNGSSSASTSTSTSTSISNSESKSAQTKTASSTYAVDITAALENVQFLHTLLQSEFVLKANPDEPEDHLHTLDAMIRWGILQQSPCKNKVEVAPTGETHFSFLCALLWPFIDSFYVASMMLYPLQPRKGMRREQMVAQAQWLGTTLYHESMLCFFESCSKETLDNAFAVLRSIGVTRVVTVGKKARVDPTGPAPATNESIELSLMFQSEAALEALVERISMFRKQPPVSKRVARKSLIADIPILAKLNTNAKL